MAVDQKWELRSPGQFQEADGTNAVTVIVNSGAPEGDTDPQYSAAKGSMYLRNDATDDEPCLYVKVDESNADDDWVAVLVNKTEQAATIESDWTWETDNAILLRDTGQKIYSPAANVGMLALAASGDTWRIGDPSGSNYLEVDFNGEMTLVGDARLNQRGRFEIFDDFTQQTLTEVDGPWIENKGSDGSAADPVINVQECGVVRLVTGAGDGSTAEDGSQIVCHIPVQADSSGLVFETRLNIDSAITNVSVCAGLTDVTTLEEPFSNAADSITSNATDAVCWLYDTSATTDEWWMCAVDSDADDTGNAASGTAPVADTFQVLRIEVSSDGNTVKYYINGALEGTLTNAGVSPSTNLYATVIACGDSTASKTVDVDYIYVGHDR